MRLAGFLILLSQKVVESVVGAVWSVVEAVSESSGLAYMLSVKIQADGRLSITSGIVEISAGIAGVFGSLHFEYVHQQSGSSGA